MGRRRRKRWQVPGTHPGTLTAHPEADAGPVRLTLMTYDASRFEEREIRPEELPGLSPPASGVLWLDVSGFSDPGAIRDVGERFDFHPLALEDVLNIPQRPKVERYGRHLQVVLREVRHPEESEQISIFLAERVVVTFQERPGDAYDRVRERLRKGDARVRAAGADFLAYALADASVDAFFPTLERLGDEIELLEEKAIEAPVPDTFREIREVKRRLIEVRRAVWPARDALSDLVRDESGLIGSETKLFLRDCCDHTVQLMDMTETLREMASGLVDEYMSSVSNRMNEIMKVLTVMATIFIPLTFLAGLYGMNFDTKASPYNMPELTWAYGYPALLLVMAAVVAGMLVHFRRRGWI